MYLNGKIAFKMHSGNNGVQKYEIKQTFVVLPWSAKTRKERKTPSSIRGAPGVGGLALLLGEFPGLGRNESRRVRLISEVVGCKFIHSSWLSTSSTGN